MTAASIFKDALHHIMEAAALIINGFSVNGKGEAASISKNVLSHLV